MLFFILLFIIFIIFAITLTLAIVLSQRHYKSDKDREYEDAEQMRYLKNMAEKKKNNTGRL